jgi:hypothetical protein
VTLDQIRGSKWTKDIVTAVRTFYEANDSPLFGKLETETRPPTKSSQATTLNVYENRQTADDY